MKLKYNHNGEVHEIPLSTNKPSGKRLAVRKNGQTYYAPLVSVTDSSANNFRLVFGGEIFALADKSILVPEITAVNVAPPSVAVMQGQSATATVSAIGNDAITGLSYGLSGAPTWITISDDVILIRPSDNDLGFAQVEVYAQDTGSDAMSAAIFAAEAKLRPIIESLSVIPPAVTVMQGQSATASVSAVANSAVGGVQYSLGDAPNWMTLNNDVIIMEPTDNDLGAATVDVLAHDINSSASAATQFVATAVLRPKITNFNANPANFSVYTTEKAYVTLSATANAAVESVQYSLTNAPSWMTLNNNVVTIAPADSNVGTVTVQAVARDTGSSVQASTSFVAQAKLQPRINSVSVNPSSLSVYNGDTGTATISVNKNSAVSSVKYTATGLPTWATLSGSTITASPPTSSTATESKTATITASDTNSTAKASATFTATAIRKIPTIEIYQTPKVPNGTYRTSQRIIVTLGASGETVPEDIEFISNDPYITISGNQATLSNTRLGKHDYTVQARSEEYGELAQTQLSYYCREREIIYASVNGSNNYTYASITANYSYSSIQPYTQNVQVYSSNNSSLISGTKPFVSGYVPKNATISIGPDKDVSVNNNKTIKKGFTISITYIPKEQSATIGTSTRQTMTVGRLHNDSVTVESGKFYWLKYKADSISSIYREE